MKNSTRKPENLPSDSVRAFRDSIRAAVKEHEIKIDVLKILDEALNGNADSIRFILENISLDGAGLSFLTDPDT